jgi:hypothetical protein
MAYGSEVVVFNDGLFRGLKITPEHELRVFRGPDRPRLLHGGALRLFWLEVCFSQRKDYSANAASD